MKNAFRLLKEDMGPYIKEAKFNTVDDALKLLGKSEYAVLKNFDFIESGIGRSASRAQLISLGIDNDTINNLRYIRHPVYNIRDIIKNLGNDSYRKQWNLSKVDANRVIDGWKQVEQGYKNSNEWIKSVDKSLGEGKFKKIFGNTQFDHTLTKAFGEGYKNVPKDLLLKGKYTSDAFNKLKNRIFDQPLVGLVNKYNKASAADKPGIQKQIKGLFAEFNARTNVPGKGGYLKEWSPNFSKTGQLTFKTSTESFSDVGRYKTNLAAEEVKQSALGMKNLGQTAEKYTYESGQLKSIEKFQAKQNKFKGLIEKAYQNAGVGGKCALNKLTKLAEGGRIGFADGSGYDQCMKNAIQEHNEKLKKGDSGARKIQFKINQNKNMKSMLGLGFKGARGLAGVIGGWGGATIEVAVEGAFYEWARRQGLTHEQAKEETFFTKLLPGVKTQTGLFEGAEPLLEKELYQLKGTEKENLGKVIGERKTVKRYIENEKALAAARNKYTQLSTAYQVATTGKERNPEKADQLITAGDNMWKEINRLEDQLDLDRDKYRAAVEKQQTV